MNCRIASSATREPRRSICNARGCTILDAGYMSRAIKGGEGNGETGTGVWQRSGGRTRRQRSWKAKKVLRRSLSRIFDIPSCIHEYCPTHVWQRATNKDVAIHFRWTSYSRASRVWNEILYYPVFRERDVYRFGVKIRRQNSSNRGHYTGCLKNQPQYFGRRFGNQRGKKDYINKGPEINWKKKLKN